MESEMRRFCQTEKAIFRHKKPRKINGKFNPVCRYTAILDLDFQDIHVQVQGDLVERAQKRPLLAERVRQQMEKTGQTPFVFDSLEILTDEAGFLPMQSLNELRRRDWKNCSSSIWPGIEERFESRKQNRNRLWQKRKGRRQKR
mgnify:CR=1 FL=1